MNALRQPATAGLLVLMTLTAHAQLATPHAQTAKPRTQMATPLPRPARPPAQSTPAPPTSPPGPAPIPLNRRVIVLDPAHGGIDSGSQISDTTVEKDVTLALAFRLRSLLTARGFTVVMTRDENGAAEPDAAGTALTLDDRAGVANHAHAAACLLLHATGSGSGVHLYSSELDAAEGQPNVVPWLTAQAAWVSQSQLLEKQVAAAFTRSGIALVASSASVRPLDSLTCPALVVELAPSGDKEDSINDTDYQQRVALSIAGALLFWQNQVQAPARLTTVSRAAASAASSQATTGAQP